jgi:rhodanese-related sulfurtransferase
MHNTARTGLAALALAALTALSPVSALAAPPPEDPARQTSWGLYVDAKEAYAMKTGSEGAGMLLVDVRDPVEIMFTGFTDVVDVNIPYLLNDRPNWNEKKSVFAMKVNPDFEARIAQALEARGLTREAPVILMCRSGGERGAPSARMLEGKGYRQVYVVVDGFEGRTMKDGERKHWRLVDGWKNSGLPWSYTLNKSKMYLQ